MKQFFVFLDLSIQRLCVFALAISAVFIGLLALIGAADIFGTSILHMPVPSAVEYSEAGLVIVVFMGLAQAQRRRAHITVDIFSAKFTGLAQRLSIGIAVIGAILFFGFIAWRSGFAAWESVLVDERSMGQISFPVWPGRVLLCTGCIIATLEALRQFAHLLCGTYDRDLREQLRD
ncbi:MAG: TRAP transporter small permease [Alphaproteobacteria bacterium]